jgi:hypothetical protein
VIGLGPHTMSTGDWIFIAVLQLALILLVVFAVRLAPPPAVGGRL